MNNELLWEVDDLLRIVDEIQEKSFQIYSKNLDKITEDKYDLAVINNASYMSNYRRKEYYKIACLETEFIDLITVRELLKVRKNQMDYNLKSININNIGTILNEIREVYHDVYTDFLINTIKN